MTKLKIILLFSAIIYCFVAIKFNLLKTKYNDESIIRGIVIDIDYKENKTVVILKGKEKLLLNYYDDFNYNLGDYIEVAGDKKEPSKNTTKGLFNYQNYLKSKNIYWVINDPKTTLIRENNNLFYKIKTFIIKRSNNRYLYSFVLGDNSYIENDVISSYRKNGISHLFSISGMHITLISSIFLWLLSKFIKRKKIIITIISIFLIFYMFLTGFTPSVIRAVCLFIIINFTKSKAKESLLIILSILLIYNPYYIYDLGFKYSFIVSFYLIHYSKYFNKNYFYNLLSISLISFLSSIPIQINNFFEINILSVFYNIIFVPLISLFLFPLSLLVFIFSFLEPIFNYLMIIFEKLSLLFSNYSVSIIVSKLPFFIVIIYYLLLLKLNKINMFILFALILLFSNIKYLDSNYKVSFIDVGQGDSIFISMPFNKSNILIDTGGNFLSNSSYISNNTLIPYFKSIGIKRIDYLIISHGDYDHMGEAINLVNNFKVEKVIFNCGEFNELEQELIEVLDKKKILYYSCIKELNIENNKLYFLNNKDYGNENDNSSVIYTELNNHKFLFMGDAGEEVEQDLSKKYNLKDIDVLKVGHHGSKTSSSKLFIDEINPKYSIISVGNKNRYGHPNKEVLDNLKDSKVYRTDQDGSIMFKIKNDKSKIETCVP